MVRMVAHVLHRGPHVDVPEPDRAVAGSRSHRQAIRTHFDAQHPARVARHGPDETLLLGVTSTTEHVKSTVKVLAKSECPD